MSRYYDELLKIKKATSGLFKGKAKHQVARKLAQCKAELQTLNGLSVPERKQALILLLNEYTDQRQYQVQMGANGFGHPEWAAAAACEGWVQECIAFIDGDPSSKMADYSDMVDELIARGS